MKRGKQTCRILKEIRRQIAEANDIAFITAECQYKGDCPGTCPKCEAEVRYLEQELAHRRMTGKLVTLAGISAGMLTMNAYPNSGGSGNAVIPPSPIELRDTINPNYVEIRWIDPKTGEKDTIKEDGTLFGIIETMPEFPDGMGALLKYIADHQVYPEELKEACVQGRVIILCDIEKDGSIRNARVKKGIHPLLDAEALRVVNSMPRWKPGTLRGEPVKVKYVIPIEFHLQALSKNSSEQESVHVYGKDKEDLPDTFPEYPGGLEKLGKDMTAYVIDMWERFGHPEWGFTGHGAGRTNVGFIVETDGSISNIEIRKRLDPVLDKEAVRFIEQMPRWTPGTKDGKIVRCYCLIPVSFRIQ